MSRITVTREVKDDKNFTYILKNFVSSKIFSSTRGSLEEDWDWDRTLRDSHRSPRTDGESGVER